MLFFLFFGTSVALVERQGRDLSANSRLYKDILGKCIDRSFSLTSVFPHRAREFY